MRKVGSSLFQVLRNAVTASNDVAASRYRVKNAAEPSGTFTDIDPLPIALAYLNLDVDQSMRFSHSPFSRLRFTDMIFPRVPFR